VFVKAREWTSEFRYERDVSEPEWLATPMPYDNRQVAERALRAVGAAWEGWSPGKPRVPAAASVPVTPMEVIRATKFAWDPRDGEIVASIEVWLEDATVTPPQFHGLLAAFLPAVDLAHRRIHAVMETGVDPGIDLTEFLPVPPESPRPPAAPVDSPAVI
jgi:hypothetical protein